MKRDYYDVLGVGRTADQEESLAELHRVAAEPGDSSIFDADDVRAISDPAEALAWVERRDLAMFEWEGEEEPDEDAARDIRLKGEEIAWLSGLLVSRQVPETTMPFETLDGFLTALVIGPETVMPSVYLDAIWGTEDGSEPIWDSPEQLEYFMGLIGRHWNAIAARREADAPHWPEIGYPGSGEPGEAWGGGFGAGMLLCKDAWEAIFEDETAGPMTLQIMAMAVGGDELEDGEREEIVDYLPEMVRMIAAYWRHGSLFPARQTPERVQKIGRNEPCPCGSGKKYKKCCALKDPPVLH